MSRLRSRRPPRFRMHLIYLINKVLVLPLFLLLLLLVLIHFVSTKQTEDESRNTF